MIEKGLDQSACIKLSRPMSPMPQFSDDECSPIKSMENVENKNSTNQNVLNGENESMQKEMKIIEHEDLDIEGI